MPELPLEVDIARLKQMRDRQEKFVLVDCREQDEYDRCRIEGSQLLPMSQIQTRVNELDGHQTDLIVVHCHHGGRSLRVAKWLRAQGYLNAQSLAGGIDEWSVQVDPTIPRY